jgi:hypothetical protein
MVQPFVVSELKLREINEPGKESFFFFPLRGKDKREEIVKEDFQCV